MAKARTSRGKAPRQNPATSLIGELADDLGIGFAIASGRGKISYANDKFRSILCGPAQSSMLGKSLQEFMDANGWRDLAVGLRRARTKPVSGEININTETGKVRTAKLALRSTGNDGNDAIFILASEVTELMQTNSALLDAKVALSRLSARILQVQDTERRKLALDLHDVTGQELAVIVMGLQHAEQKLTEPGADVAKLLREQIGLAEKVQREIRTLSYVLHPPLLDELGLSSALNWYAKGFRERSQIELVVNIPGNLPRLARDYEIALFRVVQEALTNVLRHSGSSRAWLTVTLNSSELQVSIRDEGTGIPEAPANAREPVSFGVGIQGMRERVEQLGGSLKVVSSRSGTEVITAVPLETAWDSLAQETEEVKAPDAARAHSA